MEIEISEKIVEQFRDLLETQELGAAEEKKRIEAKIDSILNTIVNQIVSFFQ